MENVWSLLRIIKNRTTWSNKSTPGYLSEENENTYLKKHIQSYVHYSIIYDIQHLKAT